ncbi:MAG: hypothetical protein CME13_01320 [Gemmatimonadetes bacterium]|nr:hypothetical protein [Gemmatimonadota bacterium]
MMAIKQIAVRPRDVGLTMPTAEEKAAERKARVRARIETSGNLPPLPGVVAKIVEMVDDEHTTARQLSTEVAKDQVVSAKVLKLVNSGFSGFSQPISTIPHAVAMLGFDTVKSLVLSSGVLELMDRARQGLWEHSLACARTCTIIAEDAALDAREEVSVTGLLHDLLGCHHGEIGAWLLAKWALPPKLIEPISDHHDFRPTRDHAQRTAAVHLADVLVRAESFGNGGTGESHAFIRRHWMCSDSIWVVSNNWWRECTVNSPISLATIRPRQMDELLQRFPRATLVVDDALRVLAANDRAVSLLGLRSSTADLKDELTRQLAAGGDATGDLGDELALATARLVAAHDEEAFEWRHQDRYCDVNVCKDSEEDRFLVFLIDVTDARLTERIHLDARHYIEAILADIPLGLTVLDAQQRITFANRHMRDLCQRLTGKGDLVELIGSNVVDLASDPTGQRWQAVCAQAMTSDTATEDERESMLDGELVVATQAQPLRLLNKNLDEKSKTKLERIEQQVKRISEVTERLRTIDEVASSEYITDGPAMVDIWGKESDTSQDVRPRGDKQ